MLAVSGVNIHGQPYTQKHMFGLSRKFLSHYYYHHGILNGQVVWKFIADGVFVCARLKLDSLLHLCHTNTHVSVAFRCSGSHHSPLPTDLVTFYIQLSKVVSDSS